LLRLLRCAADVADGSWAVLQAATGRGPKLNKEISAALADPNINARLADLGTTALALSPVDFGEFIAKETDKWAKVVKFSGAKPD
jgi:hypothetical protein